MRFIDRCLEDQIDPQDRLDQMYIDQSTLAYQNTELLHDLDSNQSVISIFESSIRSEPFYHSQIIDTRLHLANPPLRIPITECKNIPVSVAYGLRVAKGITDLYTHQVEGIKLVDSGNHIVITTNVSSGKSLVYLVPVLKSLIGQEPESAPRAIYISPTKALANDQVLSFRMLANACPGLEWVKSDTFNGDTPMDKRADIRDHAHLIFTNPDMLHLTILPNHRAWAHVFRTLSFVVLDEIHTYTGVFGAHCSWVFRRLQRVAAFYGNSKIQFITCSATIHNPVELVKSLLNVTPNHIQNTTSLSAKHLSVLWNPPLLNHKNPGVGRCSTVSETANLFVFLVSRQIRTLAFSKSRSQCELLFKTVTDLIKHKCVAILDRVKAYRAGYSVKYRRAVELGLRSNELMGVICTNALEVGVDCGGIDAVIHMGFPGKSAMKQQAGRAGRRNKDSISILVAGGSDPLDQHFVRHPDQLFDQERTDDHANVQFNVGHELVMKAHLPCAAYEIPINLKHEPVLSDLGILECAHNVLHFNKMTEVYEASCTYPSRRIPIRSINEDEFTVLDVTNSSNYRILEFMDTQRIVYTLYIGAIFLWQGQSYLVTQMSDVQKVVHVRKTEVGYYTRPRSYTDVDVLEVLASKTMGKAVIKYARLQVTTRIIGFDKLDTVTHEQIDTCEIHALPISRKAYGMIVEVPRATNNHVCCQSDLDDQKAIHTINQVLVSVAHCFVSEQSDSMKFQSACLVSNGGLQLRIHLYEIVSGLSNSGSSAIQTIFNQCHHVLKLVYQQLLVNCPCKEDGCATNLLSFFM